MILILVPVIMYIFQFIKYGLSNDRTQWGSFGDYVGGLVNPLISIASLIEPQIVFYFEII
jgi:hypothetical protein